MMVASQAALDPFGTPAFFWVDIGIFRNASDMQRFTVWPVRARVAQLPRAQVIDGWLLFQLQIW